MHLIANTETIDRLVEQGVDFSKAFHAEFEKDPTGPEASSSAANSPAGAVLCIPNTTMGRKRSLTAFSRRRACPSQQERLGPMSLAPHEGGARMLVSAGLGRPSRGMGVDMQISECEKRKINIWEQMREIEGELFILSARSGELDFADRHRFRCLCVDRTQLASELLLSELR